MNFGQDFVVVIKDFLLINSLDNSIENSNFTKDLLSPEDPFLLHKMLITSMKKHNQF